MSDYLLCIPMTPEVIEESRVRFQIQEAFPSAIGDGLIMLLKRVDPRDAELAELASTLIEMCVTAHENSAKLHDLIGRGTIVNQAPEVSQ